MLHLNNNDTPNCRGECNRGRFHDSKKGRFNAGMVIYFRIILNGYRGLLGGGGGHNTILHHTLK